MEQLISIEKQKVEDIQEALELAVLLLDAENQPPQFTIAEVFPKIDTAFQFVSGLID